MRRALSLKRESLAPLSDGELSGVVAGNQYSRDALTCPVALCLTVGPTALTCIC